MSNEKPVFEFEEVGNVLIVVPTGSLMEFRDADIRNAYNDTYRMLDADGVQHLLIDFQRLDYFGSTFVGMLIRLAKKARSGGGEAVLCHLSDNMKQMMKTLMLLENTQTDFFWVPFDDRTAALKSLTENESQQSAEAATSGQTTPTATQPEQNTATGGWSRFVK